MKAFRQRALELTKKIPKGKITTYKQLALALGRPRAFRAVGNALHANPDLIKVSCYRIVKENGFIGGYKRGMRKKKALLESEGIKFNNLKITNFNEVIINWRDLMSGATALAVKTKIRNKGFLRQKIFPGTPKPRVIKVFSRLKKG